MLTSGMDISEPVRVVWKIACFIKAADPRLLSCSPESNKDAHRRKVKSGRSGVIVTAAVITTDMPWNQE